MIKGVETFIPMKLVKRGEELLANTVAPAFDSTLLEGLARGFYWKHLMDTGVVASGSDIARREGLHFSVVNELLRMTLLAPDIIDQFMAGRQPRKLTLMWFQRNRLPVDWPAQREILSSLA
jgi:hypothetical protein